MAPGTGLAAGAVLALVFLVELVAAVVLLVLSRPSPAEREVVGQVVLTKRAMRQHRTPDTFVLRSKLERQLIGLEKDAAACKAQRGARTGTWKARLANAKFALLGLLVVGHWSAPPLLELPAWNVWPFARLLAFPGFPAGSVGVTGAVFVASQGSQRLVKALGLVEEDQGGWGASLMKMVGLG